MIGSKHILILTADAGYGHRSAAVADLAWEAAIRGPQVRTESNLPEKVERIVKDL